MAKHTIEYDEKELQEIIKKAVGMNVKTVTLRVHETHDMRGEVMGYKVACVVELNDARP
jgi:hypothetical protein